MRGVLWACLISAVLGCASDSGSPGANFPVQAASAAIQLEGSAEDVERWDEVCAGLGDPIREPAPLAPGNAPHVSFEERQVQLGLPRDLVTSAASAGRLGDRLALFLPGSFGGNWSTPGEPSVDLYLRCGERFHAVDLPSRVLDAPPDAFRGPFRASAMWDADSDGRADLLLEATGENGRPVVAAMFSERDGTFRYTPLTSLLADSRVKTLTPIDLNRDGVLDLHLGLQNFSLRVAADHATVPEFDRLLLMGADRLQVDVTKEVAGIDALGGRIATSAFVCIPPLTPDRGRLCWHGRQEDADRLFEEVAPLTFEPLDADIPVAATAAVSVLPNPYRGGVTFVTSNIGRPVLAHVDESYRVTVISDEIPMQELGVDTRLRTGPNRGRIGWGLVYDYFSNRDCPGLVIANAVTQAQQDLPIHRASGLIYYNRWCADGGWGDRFFNTSVWSGPAFQESEIRDYYQVLVVHANDDTCPDMLVTAQPWKQGSPDHLLSNPPELKLLMNRCKTPGNRVSVRLVPEDYSARVVFTLDDGTERVGFLKAPALAGTHDPVISLGLGPRRATRVCVDWGPSTAWEGPKRTCTDAPPSDRILTLTRPLR